jgi:hypothetical protein
MNYSLEIPNKKKTTNNLNRTKSIIFENKNKNEINKYHQKSYSLLRKGPNPLNHLSNSTILNNSKKYTNLLKTRNSSVSNSKLNSGCKSSKNNIYNYKPFKNKNLNNIRPQSATVTNSINEYNYKPTKLKNKSQNTSKNISLSLYHTNKHYFSSYKNVLKPAILSKFIKSSKKMQKSYKKDLEINMNQKTKNLLKIAENEINPTDHRNPGKRKHPHRFIPVNQNICYKCQCQQCKIQTCIFTSRRHTRGSHKCGYRANRQHNINKG